MPVLRKRHKENFTVLPNTLLQDTRLSCRTRGLLVWMLAKPVEWRFSHAALLAELPRDGKKAVQRSVSELQEYGYLTIEQPQTRGRLGPAVWTVSDTPLPATSNELNELSETSPHPPLSGAEKEGPYKGLSKKRVDAAAPAVKGGAQPPGFYLDACGEWRRCK